MVAIGNFKTVDGLTRDQIVMWDIAGPTAVVRPDWRTRTYEAPAPGRTTPTSGTSTSRRTASYFVVATTGAPVTGTLCDTAARFETDATGDDVRPTWVAFTGGDTLLSVAITGTAVYVGGHQRWMNNPDGARPRQRRRRAAAGHRRARPDQRHAAELEPRPQPARRRRVRAAGHPGGPLGRQRHEWIGDYDYKRDRVAFFPLADGAPPASHQVKALPAGIHLASPGTLGGGRRGRAQLRRHHGRRAQHHRPGGQLQHRPRRHPGRRQALLRQVRLQPLPADLRRQHLRRGAAGRPVQRPEVVDGERRRRVQR